MKRIVSNGRWRFGLVATILSVFVALHCSALSGAGEPAAAAVKVSEFAPAEDLINQIKYFIDRLDQSLASKDAYDDAAQSRVAKEADTVAVLALGLSLYDGKHPLSGSTGHLLAAAEALSKAGADYAAARKALDELKAAAAGKTTGPDATTPGWEPIAPLGLLMKEVPIVQSSMKRSLQSERFKTQAKQAAATAATLAMIAQAVAADDSAFKQPEQRQKWRDECIEMRDAAGAVNRAVHAGDPEAAQKAVGRLSQSCVGCHNDFRRAH